MMLMGGPTVGGLGALPWGGLVLRTPPPGRPFASAGGLTFTAPQGAGPPVRLILYQSRRVKAEVPFEFHDLPLP
jgi:hypothetical protein